MRFFGVTNFSVMIANSWPRFQYRGLSNNNDHGYQSGTLSYSINIMMIFFFMAL